VPFRQVLSDHLAHCHGPAAFLPLALAQILVKPRATDVMFLASQSMSPRARALSSLMMQTRNPFPLCRASGLSIPVGQCLVRDALAKALQMLPCWSLSNALLPSEGVLNVEDFLQEVAIHPAEDTV
jgi:hypothetical protein